MVLRFVSTSSKSGVKKRKTESTAWMKFVVATLLWSLPYQDRNLHKCWGLLPWSECMTDKRGVNRVEKWARTVWRVMVWDSLSSPQYSCCLVIDTTWIIPYRIPTSSKQPSWYKKNRPCYKCTPTPHTSLHLCFSALSASVSSLPYQSEPWSSGALDHVLCFSLSFST